MEEERGLASNENVDASIQWLEDYIEKQAEGLITATRNDTDNTNKKMILVYSIGIFLRGKITRHLLLYINPVMRDW